MIDKNKQYRTRDGREVRIYATDGGGSYPVHGAIHAYDTYCLATTWTQDGLTDKLRESDGDLIEVRPRHKRTVWLNVYPDKHGDYTQQKSIADVMAGKDRIACIKVELYFEEGEGL